MPIAAQLRVPAISASRLNALRALLRLSVLMACSFASVGCGYFVARELRGESTPAPADFSFVGQKSPCYLELQEGTKAIRVNCFHIDGALHIHSSRWTVLPRLSGESWIVTISRDSNVRVEIEDRIYAMKASPIEDERRRQQILDARGYWIAWDGIKVFRFSPRP